VRLLLSLRAQTFVDAAILAYECGMNEDSLRHELKVYKASLEQQVAPPGMVRASTAVAVAAHAQRAYTQRVRIGARSILLRVGTLFRPTAARSCSACCVAHMLPPVLYTLFSCAQALNEDGCMLGAKIVWMTLMETRSVRRWAACELWAAAHMQCHTVLVARVLDWAAELCQPLGSSQHDTHFWLDKCINTRLELSPDCAAAPLSALLHFLLLQTTQSQTTPSRTGRALSA
jgi:hypothetical protein